VPAVARMYMPPSIKVGGNLLNVGFVVAEMFLPYPSSIVNPRLLHKDYDYRNCAADNLEWVEYSDKSWTEYLEKERSDRKEYCNRLNNNKRLPHDDWC